MRRFTSGNLTIDHVRATPTAWRIEWAGRSDERNPGEALRPWLTELLQAARLAHASLELRFERLDYFNSSTVSVLLDFVEQARRNAIPLRFVYSPLVRWQRLSFEALRVMASFNPGLEVVALPGPGGLAPG